MAVGKSVLVAVVGIVVLVGGYVGVDRIRSDRAEAQFSEILGAAEVEYAAYLREAYRPVVQDVDAGLFWRPDGTIDTEALGRDPRIDEACAALSEMEREALREASSLYGEPTGPARIRYKVHLAFVYASVDHVYLGALHDEDMIDVSVPTPPFDRGDQLPDVLEAWPTVISSPGRLNGMTVSETSGIRPTLKLPECVIEAMSDFFTD